MSENLSAEQVRAENIAAMGTVLGELYTALRNELIFLCWRWEQYVDLFGEKPARVELLNRSAPFFFWVIQQVLWEDTLLAITRITGPVRSVGKDNLTVRRLPALVVAEIRRGVEARVDQVVQKADFAKDWRNRHIAHRDLALALGRAPEPLAPASRASIDKVLDDLAKLFNALSNHYLRSTTAYRGHSPTDGALALLHTIRDGLRREEIRQKHLEEGDYQPDEWDDDAPPL